MSVNTNRLVQDHAPGELEALDAEIGRLVLRLRALLAQQTAVRAHLAMAEALASEGSARE